MKGDKEKEIKNEGHREEKTKKDKARHGQRERSRDKVEEKEKY